MKKNFILLILLGLCVSFTEVSIAATLKLTADGTSGNTSQNVSFVEGEQVSGFSSINTTGDFIDTWGVTTLSDSNVLAVTVENRDAAITMSSVQLFTSTNLVNSIATAVLTATGTYTLSALLSATESYIIVVSGTGAQANTYSLTVSSVPIPAAIWLFGSALLGLVGISGRKSRTMTTE